MRAFWTHTHTLKHSTACAKRFPTLRNFSQVAPGRHVDFFLPSVAIYSLLIELFFCFHEDAQNNLEPRFPDATQFSWENKNTKDLTYVVWGTRIRWGVFMQSCSGQCWAKKIPKKQFYKQQQAAFRFLVSWNNGRSSTGPQLTRPPRWNIFDNWT